MVPKNACQGSRSLPLETPSGALTMTAEPTTKRRTGRPKKAPDELASERLPGVRCTVAERHFIELQADRAGLSVAGFCRRAALGQRILAARTKASPDARLAAELNRIGVNLNQIAHAANVGRTLSGKLDEALSRLAAALDSMEPEDGS